MRALFLSDIHLKSATEPHYEKLLQFLKEQKQNNLTHLFFLGDIFDVWVGPHDYYYKKFQTLVDELKSLKDMGIQFHYFEGNHDFSLKGFWDKRVGAIVHDTPIEIDFNGLRLRIEHGDQTNPFDKSYIRLRSFLRSTPMDFLIRNVPERIVAFVGETWSPLSRKQQVHYINAEIRTITRDFAKKLAALSNYDVMIAGHTHMKDDIEFEVRGKNRRFLNLGTWFEKPRALEIANSEIQWLEL